MPLPIMAQTFEFPSGFVVREIATNGATIHVRSGGAGPAVVLLHGYGETGDMWVPGSDAGARPHGDRARPARPGPVIQAGGGFDKKTQADDVAAFWTRWGCERADLVAHDIGNMVGFQFAAHTRSACADWC